MNKNYNKIVFFGLAGTGTSSTGKLLARELGFKFMSTGNIMRQKAKELNMSIYEFDKLCQKELKYDIELDLMVKEYGESNSNFIFESRLAWHFISDSIMIYFKCDNDLAYERIAKRDNQVIEEATKLTKSRQEVVERRYSKLYPYIIFPPKEEKFDFVIDTTRDNIKDSVIKIKYFLKNLNK